MHVQYAPHPPQYSLELTLEQLARRDSRFGHLSALWARGILGDVVQDSADLQGAHLSLRQGHGLWIGTPGRLDEHGGPDPGDPEPAHPGRRPFEGWTELALDYALALDLAGGWTPAEPDWAAQVAEWGQGVVYTFALSPGRTQPTLTRRLNLSNFFDRAEFDVLVASAFSGVAVVRCHQLSASGTPVVWRVSLASTLEPRSKQPTPAGDRTLG
ncbi:hypothetical protein [Deinococcus koreensis]|uniref:Uncharacterized protein n=1 Tax=Deinococcus koreensis TaxID=2054903 RepID=A0A2K3USH0_9DEIO|nr:hypothetical protein [Deinococcus koreensis]PNY79468.1 hypothetical protein CVO96_18715 [Deinococcus koreensis]